MTLHTRLEAAVHDAASMTDLAIALMQYPPDLDTTEEVLGAVTVRSLDAERPLPAVARAFGDVAARGLTALRLVTTLPHPDGSGAWWSHVLGVIDDKTLTISCLQALEVGSARCACLAVGDVLWFWLAAEEPLDASDAALAQAVAEFETASLQATGLSGPPEVGKQLVDLRPRPDSTTL